MRIKIVLIRERMSKVVVVIILKDNLFWIWVGLSWKKNISVFLFVWIVRGIRKVVIIKLIFVVFWVWKMFMMMAEIR